MSAVILVIHVILAAALVGIIMIQRSEGGLGGLGGGGGQGSFMTSRGTANLLTRITTFVAIGFMCTSLILAVLATNNSRTKSIVDEFDVPAMPAPIINTQPEPETPQSDPPQSETKESTPSVPIAQ